MSELTQTFLFVFDPTICVKQATNKQTNIFFPHLILLFPPLAISTSCLAFCRPFLLLPAFLPFITVQRRKLGEGKEGEVGSFETIGCKRVGTFRFCVAARRQMMMMMEMVMWSDCLPSHALIF